MGEFKVHRVRFFDYMPSAIRALAFNARTEKLALVRADASVEIFNFRDKYFQENVRTVEYLLINTLSIKVSPSHLVEMKQPCLT